jgi:hypothetical protein
MYANRLAFGDSVTSKILPFRCFGAAPLLSNNLDLESGRSVPGELA